ncbi:hypothetical protein BHU72_00165 [Desulfuribacillus stibiiarsenatis]|uniref:Uncharacterized protein n=1 Tax=Desulfuribacillus stibiiarsenatis TaxID=1390249 RepID=A0A1E5L991_9FIRM|nr:DUF6470 family protein [Desulfuribacillus stibiiarsenatis]OEH86727.1 hypothetical protein BHU72_00165 [Desulfuribacillus stibiiarsenatis]
MNIPMIQITQQSAKLQTETEQGHFQMQQRPADIQIHQKPSNLNMHTEHAKIFIDQRQAFSEVGLKHIFSKIKEYADKGRSQALRGIARIAQDGDRMAAIHIQSNPFAEFARRDQTKRVDYNIKFAPSFGSVKFNYQPTKTHFNVEPHQINTDVNINMPARQYTPGKVKSYLVQKNQIHFDVAGTNVNTNF